MICFVQECSTANLQWRNLWIWLRLNPTSLECHCALIHRTLVWWSVGLSAPKADALSTGERERERARQTEAQRHTFIERDAYVVGDFVYVTMYLFESMRVPLDCTSDSFLDVFVFDLWSFLTYFFLSLSYFSCFCSISLKEGEADFIAKVNNTLTQPISFAHPLTLIFPPLSLSCPYRVCFFLPPLSLYHFLSFSLLLSFALLSLIHPFRHDWSNATELQWSWWRLTRQARPQMHSARLKSAIAPTKSSLNCTFSLIFTLRVWGSSFYLCVV